MLRRSISGLLVVTLFVTSGCASSPSTISSLYTEPIERATKYIKGDVRFANYDLEDACSVSHQDGMTEVSFYTSDRNIVGGGITVYMHADGSLKRIVRGQ